MVAGQLCEHCFTSRGSTPTDGMFHLTPAHQPAHTHSNRHAQHTHPHMHTHVRTHTHTRTCTHTHTHTHTHTCHLCVTCHVVHHTHTHMRMRMHKQGYTCKRICRPHPFHLRTAECPGRWTPRPACRGPSIVCGGFPMLPPLLLPPPQRRSPQPGRQPGLQAGLRCRRHRRRLGAVSLLRSARVFPRVCGALQGATGCPPVPVPHPSLGRSYLHRQSTSLSPHTR